MKLAGKLTALVAGGVVALGMASTIISVFTLRGAGEYRRDGDQCSCPNCPAHFSPPVKGRRGA